MLKRYRFILIKIKQLVNQVLTMATIEKVHKYDYTDVLIWLGIAIVVLWMIGKIAGIIP